VIGTHPHCPQGWETYKGKPIFYSLGNFLFNSKEGYDYRATNRPHWYEGLCVISTISDGQLSWDVINSRNVDNIGIEVDYAAVRNTYNKQICNYLGDENSYASYLKPLQIKQAEADLKIIKRVFLPQSTKEALMLLWNCLKGKPDSEDELRFILKNDLKRRRVIRAIGNK
jgi:hypothetical protein